MNQIQTGYCLMEACRPQFAYLAKLVSGIWLKGVFFHLFRENDVRSRSELISLKNIPNGDLLRNILQQDETVELGNGNVLNSSLENDLRSGWYCLEAKMRTCKKRAKYPLADKRNNTNASRALNEHDNYNPGYDELGHCKKVFPTSSKHTSGFFLILCTCSRRCVYLIGDMDAGESSRYPRDALINRFPIAPKYIFYDDGCKFHLYCMARDPIYFFKTIFLIDSLHYANHIAICSCSYHREFYKDYAGIGEVDSQACEQFFSRIRRTIAIVIQRMNPANAILYFAVFCIFHNQIKNEKI